MREINNTKVDDAKNLDVIMPMYNFIEYCDIYSKKSGSLRKYYRNKSIDNITDSKSFKSKTKIRENTPADGNTKKC